MKKNNLILIAALLLLICCTEGKNDKEELSEKMPVNILLYNQPLDTIQKYIQGKWKLMYGYGGFTGSTYKCDKCYFEFTSDNKVNSNTFGTPNFASILWIKAFGLHTSNDTAYIMSYKDSGDFERFFVMDKIYNDTLIFHDNCDDAIYYHYIK